MRDAPSDRPVGAGTASCMPKRRMAARRFAVALLASACAALAIPSIVAAQELLDDAAQLRQLLEASDEARLDRNPLYGLYRGDTRRAALHGDYISAAYVEAE